MSTGLTVFLVIIGSVVCIALTWYSLVEMARLLAWVESRNDVTFGQFLKACFMGVPDDHPAWKIVHEGEVAVFEVEVIPAIAAGDCSALCSSEFAFTKLVFADGREILLPGAYQPEAGKRYRVVEDGNKRLLEECATSK